MTDPDAPTPETPRSSTAAPCASSRSPTTASSSGEPEAPPAPDTPHTLDLRGQTCPYTFVYTRLELERLPLGSTLAVVVDHQPATRNLPRSAREWGQEVESVEPLEPGVWRITISKRVP